MTRGIIWARREEPRVRGSSHVVFGLAGAVVVDSLFHVTGAPLLGGAVPTPDLVAQKAIYYSFAAVGALAPDIDNARSTIGRRAGILSKEIQHLAGHRTLFHSILGLALVGAIIWGAQYGLGLVLAHYGLYHAAASLGVSLAPGSPVVVGLGIAFKAFLVGYLLHLVADSLTEGGVPWLWPNHTRFGFPPNRHWRFRSGSAWEPVVVALVCLLVIGGIYTQYLTF